MVRPRRSRSVVLFVALAALSALLVVGRSQAGVNAPLLPDLRTAPLPVDPSRISVADEPGDVKKLRFENAWQNSGAGPFEIAPAANGTTQDCNENADFTDDVVVNQNVYSDANNNATFDRGIDTAVTSRPAGCMAHHVGHNHFHVDEMGRYQLIDEATGATVDDPTTKVTFCLVDTARSEPGLTGSPAAPFYTTCSQDVQGISVGWSDLYTKFTTGQEIDVTSAAAGNYCLWSMVDPGPAFEELDETNNLAEQRYFIDPVENQVTALTGACEVGVGGSPPDNDLFGSAHAISPGAVSGTNEIATKEVGEPNHADKAGGASVWYRWKPTKAGRAIASTCGSDFDTLLGVYTGASLESLKPVAANDDSSGCGAGSTQSRVAFDVVARQTYRIAVDGWGGDEGAIELVLDHQPGISVGNVRMKERDRGQRSFDFRVRLSIPYDEPVAVGFATENRSATAPKDYLAAADTITFLPGQTTATLSVLVKGDAKPEPTERFAVVLTEPNLGRILDGKGFGTIVNDDG